MSTSLYMITSLPTYLPYAQQNIVFWADRMSHHRGLFLLLSPSLSFSLHIWNLRVDPKQWFLIKDCRGVIFVQLQVDL